MDNVFDLVEPEEEPSQRREPRLKKPSALLSFLRSSAFGDLSFEEKIEHLKVFNLEVNIYRDDSNNPLYIMLTMSQNTHVSIKCSMCIICAIEWKVLALGPYILYDTDISEINKSKDFSLMVDGCSLTLWVKDTVMINGCEKYVLGIASHRGYDLTNIPWIEKTWGEMLFESMYDYRRLLDHYRFELIDLGEKIFKEFKHYGFWTTTKKLLVCDKDAFNPTISLSLIMSHRDVNMSEFMDSTKLYFLEQRSNIDGRTKRNIELSDLYLDSLTEISKDEAKECFKKNENFLFNFNQPFFGVMIHSNKGKMKIESDLYKEIKKAIYDIDNDVRYRNIAPRVRLQYWLIRIAVLSDDNSTLMVCHRWTKMIKKMRDFVKCFIKDIASVYLKKRKINSEYLKEIEYLVNENERMISRIRNQTRCSTNELMRKVFLKPQKVPYILDAYLEHCEESEEFKLPSL